MLATIMMCLLHHGVITLEVIWYHMPIGVVSRCMHKVDISRKYSSTCCKFDYVLDVVVYLVNVCDR